MSYGPRGRDKYSGGGKSREAGIKEGSFETFSNKEV
jgi:hypothetical protein